jgi:putative exosortase-associated protein (TIGR04073 family)
MMRARYTVVVILSLLLAAPMAHAAEAQKPKPALPEACPICGQPSKDYGSKAGKTFARGALNALMGWTEMMRQPAVEAREGHNVVGGIGKGIRHSTQRTLAGIGELFTFWTPKGPDGYIEFANDCPICMGRNDHQ